MTFAKPLTLPFIALSLALSTGCSAKPSPEGHAHLTEKVTTQHDHKHGKIKPSQRYLKPGASIRYEYNIPTDIAPGQTAIFQLTLNESYASGTMDVNLVADGDIQLFPSSTSASFDMSSGHEHEMDVSVTVGSLGTHYINVQAMAVSEGHSAPRIFSIPVQSGPTKKMQPHSKMTITPSGENIIVMDAQETIR